MTDLPHGWELAALEDLAAPEERSITDGPFGSNLKSAHYTDDGPRVIRLQNIGDGEFIDERAHISQEHFETLRSHEAKAGDLIVASLGADLPRACIVPRTLGPAIVKADCIRVRVHPVVNTRFVNYALQRPALRHAVADQIHGVGRPRLGMRGIRELSVPLAPQAEQERIVEALEARLEAIAHASRQLGHALTLVDSLRRSAIAEMFDEANWEWTTLGEIAEVRGGVTKDSKRQDDPEFVEVPYLRVANVQRGYLDLDEVTSIRVPPEKASALALEENDILFNEGGDRDKLGRGWIWEGQIPGCIHQNHVFRARLLDGGFDPRFVSIHGNTWGQAWFEKHGKQTTNLASINLTTLKQFPVPAPPIEDQRGLMDRLDELSTQLGALEAEIDTALRRGEALSRSVLAAAFSGQLAPQDPSDVPASELLERIRAEKPSKKRRSEKKVSW